MDYTHDSIGCLVILYENAISSQPEEYVHCPELIDPFSLQIRQMILTSLSMSDLLNSSQVSRMWRRTVSIWLSSKNHTAYIRGTCKDIRKLNRQLKLTKWTLINALSIHIPREHANCYKVMPDVDALCCNLNKLQIRSLDIYISSCKATQQLARQLVLGARSTLQELTLTYDVRLLKN